MTFDLDGTGLAAILGSVGAGLATLAAGVRHLWVSLEAERRGRLEDRAAYTEAMLAAAKALREEDARENAELRAKLEQAALPPPSTRAPARRKPRQ